MTIHIESSITATLKFRSVLFFLAYFGLIILFFVCRIDLVHNGNKANSGLARKGMCGEKTKCSINEDSGLGAGFTIAHETGHV